MLEINKIYNGDCLEIMKEIPDNSIDLVVTSPPYDNLREYQGYVFNFKNIAKELYRIVKNGGVAVWVVGDATVRGSETGTSFKQALYFKEIGFNLHDTMIYQKDAMPFPEQNRYNQCFEYMFCFSKSTPKTFNAIKEKTKNYGQVRKPSTTRKSDGSMEYQNYGLCKEYRNKFNIWKFGVGFMKSSKNPLTFQHPATFPEQLAKDHIYSWSEEGDIVLDPFVGSGTTCVVAKQMGRRYIGVDISKKYCDIAQKRLDAVNQDLFIDIK